MRWRTLALSCSIVLALLPVRAFAHHPWRSTQSDNVNAIQVHARWTVSSGYSAPPGGFVDAHLFFLIDQVDQSQDNILDSIVSPLEPAFFEIGSNDGALDHTSYTGLQFFWSKCHPTTNSRTCNRNTDYFEGPMSPSPAMVAGHLYEFLGLYTGIVGGSSQWKALIKDDTVGGGYVQGGAEGAAGSMCCSTAMDWGGEADSSGYNLTSITLPATHGDLLQYIPLGQSSFVNWPGSHIFSAGSGTDCQVDDAVWDEFGPAGSYAFKCPTDPGQGYKFAHSWTQKYTGITVYDAY